MNIMLVRNRVPVGSFRSARQRVVRRVLPANPNAAQRNLVVAVDDTQLSWQAVRYTLQELYRNGDLLHLLHVIPRDTVHLPIPLAYLASVGYSSGCMISHDDMEDALCEHAELFITQCMVGLVDACHARCQVDIVRSSRSRDSMGEAICKAADKLQAAMIIVPGHERRGPLELIFSDAHAAFGSYVAEHSSRPTLIYWPRAESEYEAERRMMANAANEVPLPLDIAAVQQS